MFSGVILKNTFTSYATDRSSSEECFDESVSVAVGECEGLTSSSNRLSLETWGKKRTTRNVLSLQAHAILHKNSKGGGGGGEICIPLSPKILK
jgi:hypothetical protein